jgi:O-antigen/teichoic acid export membrane protein
MARALAWNTAAKTLSQVFSWASTIVVARLLTPYDYGLVGMAGVYLALATVISQSGIGNTVVYARELTARQIAELNSLAIALGIVLTALTCALASPLAHFFAIPALRDVVLVAGVTYLIDAFQVVPRALLQKELRFELLSAIETVRFFFQALCCMALALLHFRYWSLVLGHILGTLLSAILTLYWKRNAFARPRLENIRREIRYARHVLVSAIAAYVYANADFAIAGRTLGAVPLGNYTVAWNIASLPVDKISSLFTGIAPAFFSAIQDDAAELRRYLLRLTEALSLITVPASIGLALVARPLILVILGPKWEDAAGPLRLLGVFIAVRSLATLVSTLLTSIGHAKYVMWFTATLAIAMPLAFLVGSHWGINGIASAWLIAYPLMLIPLYRRAMRGLQMPARDYFAAVFPAVSATTIMTVAVLAVRRLFLVAWFSPVASLISSVLVGAAAYVAVLVIFHRHRVTKFAHLLKALRKGTLSPGV